MMQREWQEDCEQYLAEHGGPAAVAAGAAAQETTTQGAATEAPAERYNLVVPRSRCPSCQRPIRAIENIPLLSYMVLGGRCAGCKAKISLRYPLVELLGGVLAGLCMWRFGLSIAGGAALLFVFAVVALTFIDLDTGYLPDQITLPLLWAGLLVNLTGAYADLASAVIGAAAGYLALWSVYHVFRLLTGKEGMGYGDFKLLAAIGAWLGWQVLPQVILLSSVVGAVVGISLIVFARHERDQPIPFGPYLAAAGVIALFYGQDLNQLYIGRF
jgi:leader peptidase (prepilin peptidase)/N-methyltransferase